MLLEAVPFGTEFERAPSNSRQSITGSQRDTKPFNIFMLYFITHKSHNTSPQPPSPGSGQTLSEQLQDLSNPMSEFVRASLRSASREGVEEWSDPFDLLRTHSSCLEALRELHRLAPGDLAPSWLIPPLLHPSNRSLAPHPNPRSSLFASPAASTDFLPALFLPFEALTLCAGLGRGGQCEAFTIKLEPAKTKLNSANFRRS